MLVSAPVSADSAAPGADSAPSRSDSAPYWPDSAPLRRIRLPTSLEPFCSTMVRRRPTIPPMADPPSPGDSSAFNGLIGQEFAEGAAWAEEVGLDPDRRSLEGPLVQRPEIFGEARRGSRRRMEEAKRSLGRKSSSDLSDEAWLQATLEISPLDRGELLSRRWSAVGLSGPDGSVMDVVAQALQIHSVAEDLSTILGFSSGAAAGVDLASWADDVVDAYERLPEAALGRLGLVPLRIAIHSTAWAIRDFAVSCGGLDVTRAQGRIGRPKDNAYRAFVTWLAAAGAQPMEIAAIANSIGVREGQKRAQGARAIDKLDLQDGPTVDVVNPVRFLAGLALQASVRAHPPDMVPRPSGLPPFLSSPPRSPAPMWERRGDWVMIPVPAWTLAGILVTAAREAEPSND